MTVAKKGANCCCSKCGVVLPNDVSSCCSCICDEICVTVTGQTPDDCIGTGTDDCSCEVAKQHLSWDPDLCAYTGTVNCGDLSIDLKFEVKKCTL